MAGQTTTRRGASDKVDLPLEKAAWHPSPLLGQMVLVSSRSVAGEACVAGKSWISMVASEPPTLCLSCRISHRTGINILETREFVVNVPGEELSSRVWDSHESSPASLEGETPAWSLIPASRVAAPRVAECRAHLECVLDSTRRFNGEEMALFGRIVAVSVDGDLLKGDPEERYRLLRPLLFLEEGLYGVVEAARRKES